MLPLWRSAPLALFLLGLFACARAPLGAGQGAFRAVQTDHFTIYTDLPKERAEEQGRQLERLLFALRDTSWESKGELPLKMNVIMFASETDFSRFARNDITGGFAVGEALFEPWIVLPAPRFGDEFGVVAHELTHAISYQSILHMPSWVSEGLASYFESAYFHLDGSFEIGSVPKGRHRSLALGWDRPSQLISEQKAERDLRFYAPSWLLVHYLMTQQADAFVHFQDQLAKGRSGPEAWKAAFPKLQGDQLDATVEDYLRAGIYEKFIFEFPESRDFFVSSCPISSADEHVLLALLWKHCNGCSERAGEYFRRDLERALSLEPDNVRAMVLRATSDGEQGLPDLESAKALARAHPGDWLAWMVLGSTALQNGQIKELSASPEWDPGAHAVALAPRQPYALALQAWTAGLRGERELALDSIRAARRIAPTNAWIQASSASLLATLCACTELQAELEIMAQNAHADFPLSTFHALREQAEKCREPAIKSD